jgi:hypothetical protein
MSRYDPDHDRIPGYILDDDNNVVPVAHILDWARWFEENNHRRQVGWRQIEVPGSEYGVTISTVFLGIDHSFGFCTHAPGEHVAIVFETMVFGGELDQLTQRYSTWVQAQAGHDQVVAEVKESLLTAATTDRTET